MEMEKDVNKSKEIKVRMTEQEKEKLSNLAKTSGLNMSELVRRLLWEPFPIIL